MCIALLELMNLARVNSRRRDLSLQNSRPPFGDLNYLIACNCFSTKLEDCRKEKRLTEMILH